MSIRTVDPTCRNCGRPLLDALSRFRRYGPDCWGDLTPAQQAQALELAAAERNPFHVPAPRPPSPQAHRNHLEVQAVTRNPDPRLCRHDQPLDVDCPACEREADHSRAAEIILRDVRAQTHEQRRADRIRILRGRYANGPPPIRLPRRNVPPPKPRARPKPPPRRTPSPPTIPGQTELL